MSTIRINLKFRLYDTLAEISSRQIIGVKLRKKPLCTWHLTMTKNILINHVGTVKHVYEQKKILHHVFQYYLKINSSWLKSNNEKTIVKIKQSFERIKKFTPFR